jgi:hypothetical protein
MENSTLPIKEMKEHWMKLKLQLPLALPPHVNSYVEQMKQYTELYNVTWIKLEQELAKAMAKQHEIRYIVGCDPYDKESESFSMGAVKGGIIEYKTNRK